MKKILLFSLVAIILLSQCTPKTGDIITNSPEVPVEVAKKETFRSTAPTPGPAPRIQMGSYEQFQLENGLQVIIVENHKLPRVSYQLFVDVPPIKEAEQSGTIEIAGDMLNKGTTTRTKSEIDESIDFIGASLNTSPRGLFGAALKKYNTNLLEIMSDVLVNPSFPESEFDKLKKQYTSNIAHGKEDPATLSSNLSHLLVYGKNHPYGEFMTGATLENVTLEGVKNYYKNWFKPNISYLVIVGDITRAEAEPLAKQYFSNWKSDNDLKNKEMKVPSSPANNMLSFIDKTGAVQSVINVTYPVNLIPGSEDEIKASVMNTLLGAGGYAGNRLHQNLREDKAYTYGAGSSLESDKYVGVFSAGASVRNEVTDSAVVEIFKEFNSIRNTKVDDVELQKVKNVMNGAFGRSLESPETIARFALNTARYNLPKDYYATYLEKISRVTADDVMAMAKKYIKPENAHIVIIGNQDEVASNLKKFSKDGLVNFYNTEYEKIEAPKRTTPPGLTAEKVIDDYLSAIGGLHKISTIKTVETKMTGDMQGMTIDVEIYQQVPDKYASLTLLNGNIINAEILNGEQGLLSGMTGPKKAEEKELKELKEKAMPFGERLLKENGYTVELAGIETINGRETYKIKMIGGNSSKGTDFYDVETNLKVRSIIVQESEGQMVSQTIDLGDYKLINGIQYPHSLKISGAGLPVPLEMTAQSIKMNEAIDESVFQIE